MKTKLLLLFVLAGSFSFKIYAQDFDIKQIPMNEEKHKIIYTGEIDLPGMSKDSVYRKTIVVLKGMVKGFAGKITKNDPESGVLIMNNVMQGMMKDPTTGDEMPDARIKYVMRFNAIEGKLTYSFMDYMVAKGKARPLESYYYNEPEVKMKKDEHIDFFHSLDYEMNGIEKSLKRKLMN